MSNSNRSEEMERIKRQSLEELGKNTVDGDTASAMNSDSELNSQVGNMPRRAFLTTVGAAGAMLLADKLLSGWTQVAHATDSDKGHVKRNSTQSSSLSSTDPEVWLKRDFGAVGDGVTDDTAKLAAAIAFSKNLRVEPGDYLLSSTIQLPPFYLIQGSGKKTTTFRIAGTAKTVFTLSGLSWDAYAGGGKFADLTFAYDDAGNPATPFFHFANVENCLFLNCVFYHTPFKFDNFHYVNFISCDSYSAYFKGQCRTAPSSASAVSEAPRWIGCFAADSPIDLEDTTDVTIQASHMFTGQFAVRTRCYNISGDGSGLYGLTLLIEGSVFDSIHGKAWDLDHTAYACIVGNFVSAGRTNNDHGALINHGFENSLTGNTFTFCGKDGLRIENGKGNVVVGNKFVNNKENGVTMSSQDSGIVVGNHFGTTHIWGGSYNQMGGLLDPAGNSVRCVVTGNVFDASLTTKVYVPTSVSKQNIVSSNVGVQDQPIVYSSLNRPSNPTTGLQIFDGSLGKPIWWNGIAGAWQDASGNNL